MKRALFWLLATFLVWEGWVYVYSRPGFWRWLALASERTSYGARDLYNRTKREQLARSGANEAVVQQSTEPLPSADNVIDAIRYFLLEHRVRSQD